jgi:hypothetical protein
MPLISQSQTTGMLHNDPDVDVAQRDVARRSKIVALRLPSLAIAVSMLE